MAAARAGRDPRSHDRAAAWLVLAVAGATTVAFNVWHAVHAGMPAPLAPLEGVAPVMVAMGLSHVVAAYRGGWFLKAATFAVMLAAMVLSLDATGSVVRPALGRSWWLFGGVVDAAALVALQVILSPESRAAAKALRQASRGPARTPAGSVPESVSGSAVSTGPESAGVQSGGRVSVQPRVQSRSPSPVPVRISEEPDARRARAAYRKSVAEGRPMSETALGAKYGKSRTWGRNRIRETEAGPHLASGTGS